MAALVSAIDWTGDITPGLMTSCRRIDIDHRIIKNKNKIEIALYWNSIWELSGCELAAGLRARAAAGR